MSPSGRHRCFCQVKVPFMKKILTLAFLLLGAQTLWAQDIVQVEYYVDI